MAGEERTYLVLQRPLGRLECELPSRLKASDPPPSTIATSTPAVVTPTMISEMQATSG